MKSEEKSTVPRVRIAVIGKGDVGKSALTVRYLTGRFIGEYHSNTDLLYNKIIVLETGPTEVEIVDVHAGNRDGETVDQDSMEFPMEQVLWSDACMIVYNITERHSFQYAVKALAELKSLQTPPVAYLVGNKADLDHLREVPIKEAAAVAAAYSMGFCEVSVAEYNPILYRAFEKLIHQAQIRPHHKPNRKFSVSKMLGTLIGVGGSGSGSGGIGNVGNLNLNGGGGGLCHLAGTYTYGGGSHYNRLMAINQGTVIPCHKGELHKPRILKRRQGIIANITAV